MKHIVAGVASLALAAALVAGLCGAVAAGDKPKKNEGYVSPHFADYGVRRIALGGLASVERHADDDKLFKDAVENAFGGSKYRFQGLATFQDAVRQAGVAAQVAALQRAALAGTPADSVAVAALQGKFAVEAILFANLTRMERNLIDQFTRGQGSTDVAADFALVAVTDGTVLWRGSFAERGLGPYNDPSTADVPERDPTGNATARSAALDPPSFRDVLDKLLGKVTASLPPPAQIVQSAAAPATPSPTATPAPTATH